MNKLTRAFRVRVYRACFTRCGTLWQRFPPRTPRCLRAPQYSCEWSSQPKKAANSSDLGQRIIGKGRSKALTFAHRICSMYPSLLAYCPTCAQYRHILSRIRTFLLFRVQFHCFPLCILSAKEEGASYHAPSKHKWNASLVSPLDWGKKRACMCVGLAMGLCAQIYEGAGRIPNYKDGVNRAPGNRHPVAGFREWGADGDPVVFPTLFGLSLHLDRQRPSGGCQQRKLANAVVLLRSFCLHRRVDTLRHGSNDSYVPRCLVPHGLPQRQLCPLLPLVNLDGIVWQHWVCRSCRNSCGYSYPPHLPAQLNLCHPVRRHCQLKARQLSSKVPLDHGA